jgi:hypothetical protein
MESTVPQPCLSCARCGDVIGVYEPAWVDGNVCADKPKRTIWCESASVYSEAPRRGMLRPGPSKAPFPRGTGIVRRIKLVPFRTSARRWEYADLWTVRHGPDLAPTTA